jgi:N-acetyl-D-muramate 6-phosphate phosphatase
VSTAARHSALLLDLDGTLLDTAPDMAGALNRLRREQGREELPFATLRPHVSHGAAALVRLGFGAPAPEEFERLRQRFLELYAEALSGGTRFFPGCEALLGALESRGIPWGIVTNKPGWLTTPLLASLGLLARAGCVVAGDTVKERKPHPLPLLYAAALLGRAPGDCVYAGDAERDIVAGRAAGMHTVAVRYGYLAEGEDPAAWQPDAIIAAPDELLDLLAPSGA